MKWRRKATVGKSDTVLYHNLSTRSKANTATETNEKTDGKQKSSISSIFSDIKTLLDDFRQGLHDFIENIITKELHEQDAISFHANPTNSDEDSGSNRVNNNGDTDTPVQNNRDNGSHNTDADQGSAVGGTPQKYTDSSIGELFTNRRRHGSKDDDKPPLKMSREILHQVDDDFGLPKGKGVAVDELLAGKISHAYFESSADNTKLQKLIKENQHPSNLMTIKPPKLNPEIESFHQFQNNTSFVTCNEKSLYSSQNFVVKTIAVMSDIANSLILASDNGPSVDQLIMQT